MKQSGYRCAVIALIPGIALAAGSFDGTWKVSLNHIQLSRKPLVYSLRDGTFTCSSCTPAYTVKADGTDQKVAGHDFDTVAVSVRWPDSLHIVCKLKGQPLYSLKVTAPADKRLVRQEETYFGDAQLLGIKSTQTIRITDHGLKMSSNGESYDAKFDGKKYSVLGSPNNAMVSLKEVSPTEVVESDFDQGRLIESVDMRATADGNTLNIVDSQLREGRTLRYHLNQQP